MSCEISIALTVGVAINTTDLEVCLALVWIGVASMDMIFVCTTSIQMWQEWEVGSSLKWREMIRWQLADTDWQTLVRQRADDRLSGHCRAYL